MKIKEIEIYAIHLPLHEPFIISYGRYDTMPSIIVKMTTDTGHIGYGEAVADDHVTGESWESTYTISHVPSFRKFAGAEECYVRILSPPNV